MECKQVELLLPDYIQGELSLEMNEFVDEHINNCPHCLKECDNLRELNQGINELSQSIEPNPGHKESLKDKLIREQRIFTASSPFLAGLHRKKEELGKRFMEERKSTGS